MIPPPIGCTMREEGPGEVYVDWNGSPYAPTDRMIVTIDGNGPGLNTLAVNGSVRLDTEGYPQQPGTTHSYGLQARSEDGSDVSEIVTVAEAFDVRPANPEVLSAEPGASGEIVLTWHAQDGWVYDSNTQMVVTISEGENAQAEVARVDASLGTVTLTGLTPGAMHYGAITADYNGKTTGASGFNAAAGE